MYKRLMAPDQISHTQSMVAESGRKHSYPDVKKSLKPLHNIGKTKTQNLSQIYT